jgi:fructokinase
VRVGVDLGGTKIEAIALEDSGEIVARERLATPRDYAGTIDAIVELIGRVERLVGKTGSVGIGIPGVLDPPTGFVKNANSTWLIGEPLGRDLSAALSREVRLANDANCFALSEASDGAAAGARVVFGVILGTGVGGGIVVDGHVLEGPNLIAGEWGHNPLPWLTPDEYPGPDCYCGRRGCIEMFLSGPGFEADYARHAGVKLTSRAIVSAANGGEPHAVSAIARYHDRLGRALAGVLNLLDPDVVVLGGGMSNLPDLATAATESTTYYVFSETLGTRIVSNQHGDSSGVRGAAWLWPA